jgi:hypothetical protein
MNAGNSLSAPLFEKDFCNMALINIQQTEPSYFKVWGLLMELNFKSFVAKQLNSELKSLVLISGKRLMAEFSQRY